MTIIATNKKYLPSFGVTPQGYQGPLCIVTVLFMGPFGRDCAAYTGIIPDTSKAADPKAAFAIACSEVRRGGNKLMKAEAEKMFGDFVHDGVELGYRR